MLQFRLKTAAEVAEEVRKAREGSGDELVDEIFGLGDPHVDLIKSQPVREEPVAPAPDLTPAEDAAVDARLEDEQVWLRLFGYAPDSALPQNEIAREAFLEGEHESLVKVLGPDRARKAMRYMYGGGGESAAVDPVSKLVGYTREKLAELLLKRLSEHGDGIEHERLAKFVAAWKKDDKEAMRQVARALVAA